MTLLERWRALTPQQRDYDRLVAKSIPVGATWGAETKEGQKLEAETFDADDLLDRGCTCHRCPPCSFCVSLTEEEFNAYTKGGAEAVRELRRAA